MNRALFYRNAENLKEYNNAIKKYKKYTDNLNYSIAKKILLKKEQYIFFINNFKIEQKFIIDNINLMHMDENDNISCLLVYCKYYNNGILIYSAGYNYARYIAKCLNI